MIFYVIGAMGFLAALLVFFVIPETHKQENRIPLRLNIIARNFMTLSKQKKCWVIWRRLLFGFGGLFAFVTAGSIVLYRYLWHSSRSIWLFLYDQYRDYDRCFLSKWEICIEARC